MLRAAAATLPHFKLPTVSQPRGMRPLGDTGDAVRPNAGDGLDRLRRELLAEAQANFERTRAADLAAHEAELAARERQYNEQTATVLTERLAAAIAEIHQRLAGEVARALTRFLATAIRDRALGELGDTVAALLARKGGASIRVSGPARLVEALRAKLPQDGAGVAFDADEDATDVTVRFDDTVIRTAIAEWTARLCSAGADGTVPTDG